MAECVLRPPRNFSEIYPYKNIELFSEEVPCSFYSISLHRTINVVLLGNIYFRKYQDKI